MAVDGDVGPMAEAVVLYIQEMSFRKPPQRTLAGQSGVC